MSGTLLGALAFGVISLISVPSTQDFTVDNMSDKPTIPYEISGSVSGKVTGTITYRQKIALPPDAVVTVSLQDVSLQDAPTKIISQQVIKSPGQVPIPFSISYDPKAIDGKNTYAIGVRITVGDKLLFTNKNSYQVITKEKPSVIEVMVEQVTN